MNAALVVLAILGIVCVPTGLFVALRRVAPLTPPPPVPLRVAISVPQHATLTRVGPHALDPPPVLELTPSPDGVYR